MGWKLGTKESRAEKKRGTRGEKNRGGEGRAIIPKKSCSNKGQTR